MPIAPKWNQEEASSCSQTTASAQDSDTGCPFKIVMSWYQEPDAGQRLRGPLRPTQAHRPRTGGLRPAGCPVPRGAQRSEPVGDLASCGENALRGLARQGSDSVPQASGPARSRPHIPPWDWGSRSGLQFHAVVVHIHSAAVIRVSWVRGTPPASTTIWVSGNTDWPRV